MKKNTQYRNIQATVSVDRPEPTGSILRDLLVDVSRGKIVAIVGPSGIGKSTLLWALAGLIGRVEHDESCPGENRNLCLKSLSMAYQEPIMPPWLNVAESIAYEKWMLSGIRTSSDSIKELLSDLVLDKTWCLYSHQLSLGMRQRVQLARVLNSDQKILLLDEPLGAVDQPMRMRIASYLRGMVKSANQTVLYVTHDCHEAALVSDEIWVVSGRPMEVVERVEVGSERSARPDNSQLREGLASGSSSEEIAGYLQGRISSLDRGTECAKPVFKGRRWNRLWGVERQKATAILLFFGVFVGIWEVLIGVRPSLSFYLPPPTIWLKALWVGITDGDLSRNILITLAEAGAGFALASLLGIPLGFATMTSKRVLLGLRVTLVGATAIPLFVLAPLFILWVGVGIEMKVAVASLSALPILAHSIVEANSNMRDIFSSYFRLRGVGFWRRVVGLELPIVFDGALAGVRPAAVAALIGAFLGEFIAAEEGLGYFILISASRYRAADVLAGVFVLFAVAILVDQGAQWVRNKRAEIVRLVSSRKMIVRETK